MKTEDLIQLGALAAIGYLAYQKFGAAHSNSPVSAPTRPTTTLPPLLPDFGSTNPDAGWGDDTGAGIGFVQAIIGGIL